MRVKNKAQKSMLLCARCQLAAVSSRALGSKECDTVPVG